ncbi:phospholipid phosphatase-related protein type 1-like isoform X2 [Strongylocentrotus purpuratus]|uniref:Phosphatidic acid phosphatase type 2/haloperoxidase domain-containing protein n=1 Tax=Strongylocentrotus purpuratus TaxID=7668 RepID=A0A7M7T3U4_STRPU|nr:phospholipid phosphatase-related protein type 1-like isoform X2 [Strongylocentrotus purpuratus]
MAGRHGNETSNNWLIPCFFLFDCILLAAVVVLWYFMEWQTQTFTLHDATIPCTDIAYYSYPERVDIVPETIVFVLAFVLPPIVVLFGEAAVGLYNLQGGKKQLFMEKSVMTFGMKLHALLRRTVRFTGIFLLGAFITWILTRAGQLILSHPAPDFFTRSTCTPCSNGADGTFTISDCTTIIDSARQSFPSLYASLSAYASVYVAVYITMLMKLNAAHTLRPFAGLCFIAVPYLLGVQQIAAHRAHWGDVIGGWILGSVVAFYLIYGVLDAFLGPLMSTTSPRMDNGVGANEDYVIEHEHALHNGNAHPEPMVMNGLRHSQRDRDGYTDRGMEMNSESTMRRQYRGY